MNINKLNIGDKIGFAFEADSIDAADKIMFFPVVELTRRDGENAYYYEFPDGTRSGSAIRHSELANRQLQIKAQIDPRMICCSTRREEFAEALHRSRDENLIVYDDFDAENFVVVNLEKLTEYRVRLETHQNRVWGICTCPDFTYRKRTCKHISTVLTETLFSPVRA